MGPTAYYRETSPLVYRGMLLVNERAAGFSRPLSQESRWGEDSADGPSDNGRVNAATDLGFRVMWRALNEAARLHGDRAITGMLERPRRSQAFMQWVDVQGWALARSGERLLVRIVVNGRLLKELPLTVARPEIIARHKATAVDPVCGFDDVVSLDGLNLPSYSLLTARAVSTARRSRGRSLGVALLRRRRGREREVPRHAYQDTWDAVSRNLSDARFSVAGTADSTEIERTGELTAIDVAREAAITPADRVLEIGCGVGRVGRKLAPLCREWVGADVSRNMLRYARHALEGQANVDFVHLNGINLSGIPDASFDVVYCTAVFMHLDEWDRFRYVCEALRVLKPGGRMYFDNISLVSPDGWRLFEQLARYDPAARPPNISKASTPEELRTYAEKAGFTNVRVRVGTVLVTVTGVKRPERDRSDALAVPP
jgi:SAM-dependent methyltransferase